MMNIALSKQFLYKPNQSMLVYCTADRQKARSIIITCWAKTLYEKETQWRAFVRNVRPRFPYILAVHAPTFYITKQWWAAAQAIIIVIICMTKLLYSDWLRGVQLLIFINCTAVQLMIFFVLSWKILTHSTVNYHNKVTV